LDMPAMRPACIVTSYAPTPPDGRAAHEPTVRVRRGARHRLLKSAFVTPDENGEEGTIQLWQVALGDVVVRRSPCNNAVAVTLSHPSLHAGRVHHRARKLEDCWHGEGFEDALYCLCRQRHR
jgi:hypothetical protein